MKDALADLADTTLRDSGDVEMVTVQRWWCPDGFEYQPEAVKQWLALLSSVTGDLEHNARRGVVVLHKQKGSDVSQNGEAGGILDLLHQADHASNIVLEAYSRS